jgi:rsbT co-antagonist protein RsbR
LILVSGYILEGMLRRKVTFFPISTFTTSIAITFLGHGIIGQQMFNPLQQLTQELENRVQERTRELEAAYAEMEQRVEARTAELQQEIGERERLQQEIIKAQQLAIHELSTPIIPVMDTPQGNIIVAPLIGSIDSQRAKEITRALLAGIRQHQAAVVILDITGVSIVDSGVANHLNKTIQAARLKGTHTIVTGISEAVAETIVELGIDWDEIDTLSDLQSGLAAALNSLGMALTPSEPG